MTVTLRGSFYVRECSLEFEVVGRGHSSPVIVGDRVFLTTADTTTQVHSVLAYDRKSGLPRWKTDVSQGGFPARNHPKNTEATATVAVACDGERLFAAFFHHETIELFTLDLDGKVLWKQTAGPFNPKRYEYGYSPSPLLYRGTVIVSGEYDGDSFLTAFDRASGKRAWRTARPANITFSSPVVGKSGTPTFCGTSGKSGTPTFRRPDCGTSVRSARSQQAAVVRCQVMKSPHGDDGWKRRSNAAPSPLTKEGACVHRSHE